MTRQKMTRWELTKEIAKRLKDICELYYSVYPEGNCLDICIKNGYVSFKNQHYQGQADENYLIDYWECEDWVRINEIWEKK